MDVVFCSLNDNSQSTASQVGSLLNEEKAGLNFLINGAQIGNSVHYALISSAAQQIVEVDWTLVSKVQIDQIQLKTASGSNGAAGLLRAFEITKQQQLKLRNAGTPVVFCKHDMLLTDVLRPEAYVDPKKTDRENFLNMCQVLDNIEEVPDEKLTKTWINLRTMCQELDFVGLVPDYHFFIFLVGNRVCEPLARQLTSNVLTFGELGQDKYRLLVQQTIMGASYIAPIAPVSFPPTFQQTRMPAASYMPPPPAAPVQPIAPPPPAPQQPPAAPPAQPIRSSRKPRAADRDGFNKS